MDESVESKIQELREVLLQCREKKPNIDYSDLFSRLDQTQQEYEEVSNEQKHANQQSKFLKSNLASLENYQQEQIDKATSETANANAIKDRMIRCINTILNVIFPGQSLRTNASRIDIMRVVSNLQTLLMNLQNGESIQALKHRDLLLRSKTTKMRGEISALKTQQEAKMHELKYIHSNIKDQLESNERRPQPLQQEFIDNASIEQKTRLLQLDKKDLDLRLAIIQLEEQCVQYV